MSLKYAFCSVSYASFHRQVTSATSTIEFHSLESGIFVASSYSSVNYPNIFNVNLSLQSVVLQTYAVILGLWIVFLCLIRILERIILVSHCPYVHRKDPYSYVHTRPGFWSWDFSVWTVEENTHFRPCVHCHQQIRCFGVIFSPASSLL